MLELRKACFALFYAFHIFNMQEGIFANCFFEKSFLTVLKLKSCQYLLATIFPSAYIPD